MSRRRSALMAAALGLVLGCAERLASSDDPELVPYCMLYPATVSRDGHNEFLVAADGSTGRVCMCMTFEDYLMQTYVEELNDWALEECLELAADFDTNDCQQMYDAGEWLTMVRGVRSWATGDEGVGCWGGSCWWCSLGFVLAVEQYGDEQTPRCPVLYPARVTAMERTGS